MRAPYSLCAVLLASYIPSVVLAQGGNRWPSQSWGRFPGGQPSSPSSSSTTSPTSTYVAPASTHVGGTTTNAVGPVSGNTLLATKLSSASQAVVTGAIVSTSLGHQVVNSAVSSAINGGSVTAGASLAGSGIVAASATTGAAANPTGGSQICFKFTGSSFYYQNAYTWGTKSGPGTDQCFPIVAGGAMFLSSSPISGDGDLQGLTKLECTFGGQYQNCDISLVDGFSIPVSCTIPGGSPPTIGGTSNLWTLGAKCDSPNADGACNNAQGYAASRDAVTPFFQQANWTSQSVPMPAGGNYCIWQFCSPLSDSFFTGTPTITCQVGKGGASSKARRDDNEYLLPRHADEVRSEAIDGAPERRELDAARPYAAVRRSEAVGARAHARNIKGVGQASGF